MNAKLILAALAVVIIVGAAIALSGGYTQTSGSLINSQSQPTTALNQTNASPSKVLFANTQYAQYSYQIYPGAMSAQAKAALAGFNMTLAQLQNGSAQVRILLVGTNQSQIFTLKPNYKLYIIETSFGDDQFDSDSSLGDDGFAVVDQSGYVAQ